MNILLSAYSINPYKGSEDAVGWNWALTLSRKLPDSTIYILTRTYNEIATKKGIYFQNSFFAKIAFYFAAVNSFKKSSNVSISSLVPMEIRR